MWIARARYDELLRAEERAEWLRVRVNQLEHERAELSFHLTGKPQRALEISGIKGKPKRADAGGSLDIDMLKEMSSGTVSFDDMGDEAATVEGIHWDDEGRVKV